MASVKLLSDGRARVRVKVGEKVRQKICSVSDIEEVVEQLKNNGPLAYVVFREFLAKKRGELSPQSMSRLESTVRVHILPAVRGIRWEDVTADVINGTLTGGSCSSLKKVREAWSACDRYALSLGISSKSIMCGVRSISEQAPRPVEVLSSRDIEAIKSSVDRWSAVWLFMLSTGIRAGEMCALKWEDIRGRDLFVHATAIMDNGRVKVKSSPKTFSSIRSIPLCEEALHALQRVRVFWGGEGYLIHTVKGGVVPPSYLSQIYRRYAERLGVSHTRNSCHALRDTFASRLINAGVELITVSRLLGHRDSRITERYYISLSDSKKRDAVSLIFPSVKPEF